MNDAFSVTARRDGNHAVIDVVGEFDLAATSEFAACAQLLLQSVQRVVVDLSKVSFLDSSGLNALLRLRQAANEAGGSVTLRDPTDRVRKLLSRAGLTDILPIEA